MNPQMKMYSPNPRARRHWAMPNMHQNGSGYDGKEDDITVTVAQVFHSKEGEERKNTAQNDTFFTELKKVYTSEDIPHNRYEHFKRARFDTI